MSNTVPSQIKHQDLMVAMCPLFDLLGVEATELFVDEPMLIGRQVSFVAIPEVALRTGLPAETITLGSGSEAQYAVRISVPIDVFA